MYSIRLLLLTAAMAAAQSACALGGTDAGAATELKLLVKPVNDVDGRALLIQVSQASGLPVDAVKAGASVGWPWQAVSLLCRNAAGCDAALDRLRADKTHFASVEVDQVRKAIPRTPSP
jgi:hypothetical protein